MKLEQCKSEALELLAAFEPTEEVSLDPYKREIWLGVGYLVAKGWATYKGANHYSITKAGQTAYHEFEDERS